MKKPTFFGVRHLSPAAAFHLRRALDRANPRLVLVEGPSDLNGQMAWLCHPETKFPAAILAYTKTPPVRTVLWPFAIYSPEVQAILWGAGWRLYPELSERMPLSESRNETRSVPIHISLDI